MLPLHFIYSYDVASVNSLIKDIKSNNQYFIVPIWDQICLNELWNKVGDRYMVHTAKTRKRWREAHPKIFQYLKIRFEDSDSLSETMFRIANHIEERPHCQYKNCKGHVIYHQTKGFYKFCCYKHAQLAEQTRTKIETTSYERYGTRITSQAECVKETAKRNNLAKYGKEWSMQREDVKQKSIETCRRKYNCDYSSQAEITKQHTRENCFAKYGVYSHMQREEVKQNLRNSFLEKYHVDNYAKTQEFKDRIHAQREEINAKVYATMKRNNSFRVSKKEEELYFYLKDAFAENDIEREYKTIVYPFKCDFYIKSLNLYIEYQGTWMHGMHPYDKNNLNDREKLDYWKSHENSKQYQYAALGWSYRDPLKRQTAKNNNLNYLEIFPDFPLEEVPNFIKENFNIDNPKQIIVGEK